MTTTQTGKGNGTLRRSCGTGAIVGAPLLSMAFPPTTAHAATVVHDRVSAQFAEPDFCGSGLAVEVTARGIQNIQLGEDGIRGTGEIHVVITNPENGASVILSSAGQVRGELLSGEHDGLHSHLVTVRGLPEKIQTAGGAVLLRDAGLIAFVDTFDGQQFISSEIVLNRGPHPEADADFTLFCGVVVAALS